jgi:hypothetical protein
LIRRRNLGDEYRHIDFGSISVSTAIPDDLGTTCAKATSEVEFTVDQVTARLNYRVAPR